jgi:hypothetical protein
MPKAELLSLLEERLGMTLEYVIKKFNTDWSKRRPKLFHHHGGGVWSTANHKFTTRGKVSADKLSELKDKAKESRRRGKDRTERQDQFWTLFETLPNCVPNYDNPAECPMWKHVESDPVRLDALLEIQSNAASPKVRQMPGWKYVAYLRENLRNFIRDDLFVPYFKVGKYRQGKQWYPREMFREMPRMEASRAAEWLARQDYLSENKQSIIDRAKAAGDFVVQYRSVWRTVEGKKGRPTQDSDTIREVVGANVLEQEELYKKREELIKDVDFRLHNFLNGLIWLTERDKSQIKQAAKEAMTPDGVEYTKFYNAVCGDRTHGASVDMFIEDAEKAKAIRFKEPYLKRSSLIRKLIALSEKTVANGCTSGEANAAEVKLAALMKEHGVDMCEIESWRRVWGMTAAQEAGTGELTFETKV